MLMEWARSQEEKNRIPSDRIDYLDAAKGISILLIVCLHHLNGSDLAKKIFCSISIVPFILISGFLYAYKNEWEKPFRSVILRSAQRLLYPFATFSVILLIWNVLYYKVVFPTAIPEYSMQKMLIYTITTYGYNALWYLPLIFWATLLFVAIRKTNHHHVICIVSSIALIVFYILFDKQLTGRGLVSYIYCYTFRVMIATVFLYVGYVLFFVLKNMNEKQENLLLISCVIVFAIIVALYRFYPEQFPIVNLAAHRLGNPYVYYLASIAASVVIILICKKYLGANAVLRYFGKNSLIVMALHMDITVRIAWWILSKLHINFGDVVNSLCVIALELAMFPIIITVINKCFPFLLRFPSLNAKKS